MNFIPLLFYSPAFFILMVYLFFIIRAVAGIKSIRPQLPRKYKRNIRVDVIIAYRNEADNLPALINDLRQQSYSNFRIIWVNDHSTDDSLRIVQDAANHLHTVFFNATERGKKAAIAEAVSYSDAPLMVFTDADCRLPEHWITAYAAMYERHGSGLFFGPVFYNTGNHLQQLFALEFLSLVGTGMGLAAKGLPVYMNGANYAFTRDMAEALPNQKGKALVSGDDVFLLHSVKAQFGHQKIIPVPASASVVYTDAPKNIRAFFFQRMRWGGKAAGYHNRISLMLALTVVLLAFFQLCSFALPEYWHLLILLWIIKGAVDYYALSHFAAKWQQKPLLINFPVVFVVYPFYIILTALAGLISFKGHWYR